MAVLPPLVRQLMDYLVVGFPKHAWWIEGTYL
jgi:hypothetical protein